MATLDLTTYEGQVARLDREYIEVLGNHIHEALAERPMALNYEPGNGTVYDLLFVPQVGITQLGTRVVGARHYRPEARWCIVSKCNLSESDWVYVFDLTPGQFHFASYVSEKTGTNLADASALTALFRAICGVPQ